MSSKIISGDCSSIQSFPWKSVAVSVATPEPEVLEDMIASEPESYQTNQQVDLQREAEISQRIDAAWNEGYRKGIAEGEQSALRHLEPLMTKLAHTIETLAATRPGLRREAEEDVVRLSVAIARRILNREISMDPDALLGMVNTAFSRLDAREVHRVLVHPNDVQSVQGSLSHLSLPQQVNVIADSKLERGSVLFETSRGTLDASMSTQLQEIERGLVDRAVRRS